MYLLLCVAFVCLWLFPVLAGDRDQNDVSPLVQKCIWAIQKPDDKDRSVSILSMIAYGEERSSLIKQKIFDEYLPIGEDFIATSQEEKIFSYIISKIFQQSHRYKWGLEKAFKFTKGELAIREKLEKSDNFIPVCDLWLRLNKKLSKTLIETIDDLNLIESSQKIKPIVFDGKNEGVLYVGNVPPSPLYSDKNLNLFYFPQAPYITTYHPNRCQCIHAAFELPFSEGFRKFFNLGSEEKLSRVFIVAQEFSERVEVDAVLDAAKKKIIKPAVVDSTQRLRLHGLVRGGQPGNQQVAVRVSPLAQGPLITLKTDIHGGSVHTHDGVASPNNFALQGIDQKLYESSEFQGFSIYLPEYQTATLIILCQKFWTNPLEPGILTKEAENFLSTIFQG